MAQNITKMKGVKNDSMVQKTADDNYETLILTTDNI